MAFGYPISLELSGRRALVVGERAVEEGKVEGLLAAGAGVTVVARRPAARLDRLERDARVTVARRGFRTEDLDGVAVCVASSDDRDLGAAIAGEARARGVLVNVMDQVEHCDFASPAVVRRGDLVIAVSTGGRSPRQPPSSERSWRTGSGPSGRRCSRWSATSAPRPCRSCPTSRSEPGDGGGRWTSTRW